MVGSGLYPPFGCLSEAVLLTAWHPTRNHISLLILQKMQFFKKYIFPPLYGLLVYFTVRLLHDTDLNQHFWERALYINLIEMGCSVLVGFISIYLFRWLFRFYDRRWSVQVSYQGVLRELSILVGVNLVLVNAIFVPMDVALHNDWP